MTSINTYEDLLHKKQMLKLSLETKKEAMKNEFEALKLKFKPIGNVVDTIGDLTHRDKSNPLVNVGLDLAVNFLIKKVLFRNAGILTKIIAPIFVSNFLSNKIAKEDHIVSKVVNFFKGFKKKQ